MFHKLWVEWFAGKFKIVASDGEVACHAVNALEAGVTATVLAGHCTIVNGVVFTTA